MKPFGSMILGLVALLAAPAISRPHAMEELPETSQMTAFVVLDNGTALLECWELTNMLNERRVVPLQDGQDGLVPGLASAVNMAKSGELSSVDIATFPSRSIIWPPHDASAADDGRNPAFNYKVGVNALLLTATFEVTIQRVTGNETNPSSIDEEKKNEHYTFSPMNGDNWFYFRDDYTGSALASSPGAPPPPVTVRSTSATDNQAMFFKFAKTPEHKVLHSNACSFSGVETPTDTQARRDAQRIRYSASQVALNPT